MYVKKDISLRDFEFWSGARHIAALFTYEELDIIEEYLEKGCEGCETLTETQINDLFWFEIEECWGIYSEVIGYEGSFEDFYNERRQA